MKTRCMKVDWLVPWLGIAVVAGALMAATAYLELQRRVRASEELTATLEGLHASQILSAALKAIHDGQTDAAAQRLDLLLCGTILRFNEGLASADAQTRAYVQEGFRRIALTCPKTAAGELGASAQTFNEDQAAVEGILARALTSTHTAQVR
jgi:hypothetical protein